MSITSVTYLACLPVCLAIYLFLPAKYQWTALLVFSLVFYCCNAKWYTLMFAGITLCTVYCAARYFESGRSHRKAVLVLALVGNIVLLAMLKYMNLLCAPLAMSYYMLQMLSYLLDCYWESIRAQKNIFKLFLYMIYFPQMVTGPISRYDSLGNELFTEHRFDYGRVTAGLKRIAWGLVKKLVIAVTIGTIVDIMFANADHYVGLAAWVAMFLFTIQLYADFSGAMDIVIGVSNCFGITLTENFNYPMLSKTTQEFWQRWHISLGGVAS